MKSKSMFMQVLAIILVLLMAVPPVLFAQDGGPTPLKREEIEQLVAPIALYPDSLLAQILMASTYPLDVVQAARWAKNNKNLQGDKLEAELKKKAWDPSVKSMIAFPQILTMMNDNLEWTQKLGNTFLVQQKDVMNAVQRLRGKAYAAGYLKTSNEQKVIVEKTVETQIIRIEPATQVVYVPTYNTTVVYGVWAYPAYPPPPVYPPGYVATTAAFAFVAGVAVGSAMYGGCSWGHVDSSVTVNRNYNVNRPVPPPPRPGAPRPGATPYAGNANAAAWQRNQGGANRPQTQQNMQSRGYGQTGAKPAQQPSASQRPAQQPSASQRPAQQPSASQRPAQQPSASQRPAQPSTSQRPSSQPSAFNNAGNSGMQERAASSQGKSSLGSSGFGSRGGGGGGFQGGGRGGGGRRR